MFFASPLLFKERWTNDSNKDPPCIIIKCFLCFLCCVILEEFRGFHPAHLDSGREKYYLYRWQGQMVVWSAGVPSLFP